MADTPVNFSMFKSNTSSGFIRFFCWDVTRHFLFLILFLFLFLARPQRVSAQYSEVGILAGVSDYNGELNPGLLNFKFLHPAGGLMYRYNLNPHWALKGNAYYGIVSGADAQSTDPFQQNRNLSFKSGLLDVSGEFEFNFFPYEPSNTRTIVTPYIFAGISLFKFNPKAEFNGTWYALQTLGTEGQGNALVPDSKPEYSLTQFAIPFGGGMKISVKKFSFGVELGVRRAYTDYLDDVSGTYVDPVALVASKGMIAAILADRSVIHSPDTGVGRQRGNPNDKDWYMFTGLYCALNILKKGQECNAFPHHR